MTSLTRGTLLAIVVAALLPAFSAGATPRVPTSPPGEATLGPCSPCGPPAESYFQYQLAPSNGHEDTGGIDLTVMNKPFGSGDDVVPMVFDIDLYVDAEVDGDGHNRNKKAVAGIHELGGYAICYVSAGSWEKWRPDAAAFPRNVKGRSNGWPGERWLDIRERADLLPIMRKRAKKCAKADFDAIEWDNVDGYTNRTGFPLRPAQQLRFNRALARIAHARGLAVGLKNDLGQIDALVDHFDFAVNEQCSQFRECRMLKPFLDRDKPVYQVEYRRTRAEFCPRAIGAGRTAILKRFSLHARPWKRC